MALGRSVRSHSSLARRGGARPVIHKRNGRCARGFRRRICRPGPAHITNSFWRRLTMCSHRYLHHAVPLIAGAAALLLSAGAADARVTRIVISQTTSPAFDGQTLGFIGPYEMIRGTASGEIDPVDRRNAVITYIYIAPRNANGKVEYSATFTLLK